MMDEQWQKEILDSIEKYGKVEFHDIINGNIDHLISRSSGKPRIQTNAIRKARLILGKPAELDHVDNVLIKCGLCKRVITYPAWYLDTKAIVNHFHYFICFDSSSPLKPTARCYKRS
jgi:hypothetical protein